MKVTRLLAAAPASVSVESAVLDIPSAGPLTDSATVFIQLTENPAADDINLRLRGRASADGEWYTIATFNSGTTWHVPTGTVRTFANRFADVLFPQMSFQMIGVSLSTNLVTAYLLGY